MKSPISSRYQLPPDRRRSAAGSLSSLCSHALILGDQALEHLVTILARAALDALPQHLADTLDADSLDHAIGLDRLNADAHGFVPRCVFSSLDRLIQAIHKLAR